jgi:hypothetical protein
MWFWESPAQMTEQAAITALDAVKAQGINAVYITIDDYLDVIDVPAGSIRDNAIKNYSAKVSKFISLANTRGIVVDAEGGAKDWVNPGKTQYASTLLKYVNDYNKSNSIKFRGMQYDIEPYLLPNYETDKGTVLKSYITLIDNLVQQNKSYGLPISLAVPHFYDSVNQWTPVINHNGKNAYTFTHLLNLLDQAPGSKLMIMAYRDTATGTIDISKDEINESKGHNTKVIVAQEVGNVDPNYVTFFGKTYSYFKQQVGLINTNFQNQSSYAGTAVNYLEPFLELTKR